MCDRPTTKDGFTFSCRTCDACIAVKRAEWVARGVMEMSFHKFCLVIGMTYSDDTQFTRDGAAMFRYNDVRLFLDALRKAVRVVDDSARIRFLVAGEQGDRRGRCHWHAVIYSNIDPVSMGIKKRVLGRKLVVCDKRELLMTVGKPEIRVNWSLWPHGYVTFQDADEGGIHYALSYATKDQFTGEKSLGTGRYDKSENFATGMFRMSKRPPIGERWLWNTLEVCYERGVTPVSLNFKVPGLSGYYHPSGRFRKLILGALYSLNKRILWATGRIADQWPSLVGSIGPALTSDLETLQNGQKPDENITQWASVDPDNFVSFDTQISLAGRERARQGERYRFARECGENIACDWCLYQQTDAQLAEQGVTVIFDENAGGLCVKSTGGKAASEIRYFVGSSNPYCRKRGSRLSREAFPDSDRTKARA